MNPVRIFFLFFCLPVLFSCENDLNKVKLYSKGKVSPQESARNIKILYSDSARLQVEITAPLLNHYETENPYIEMPKGFKATFYNDKLEVKSKLDADYGIRYERDQRMEAANATTKNIPRSTHSEQREKGQVSAEER